MTAHSEQPARQELDLKPTPSDIIGGILAYTQEDDFVYPVGRIHAVVAKLRGTYPILRPFAFDPRDVVPFSDALEGALNILRLARIFHPPDSNYDRYAVTPEGRRFIENRILPRFTEDEINQLKALGGEFDRRLSLKLSLADSQSR